MHTGGACWYAAISSLPAIALQILPAAPSVGVLEPSPFELSEWP